MFFFLFSSLSLSGVCLHGYHDEQNLWNGSSHADNSSLVFSKENVPKLPCNLMKIRDFGRYILFCKPWLEKKVGLLSAAVSCRSSTSFHALHFSFSSLRWTSWWNYDWSMSYFKLLQQVVMLTQQCLVTQMVVAIPPVNYDLHHLLLYTSCPKFRVSPL